MAMAICPCTYAVEEKPGCGRYMVSPSRAQIAKELGYTDKQLMTRLPSTGRLVDTFTFNNRRFYVAGVQFTDSAMVVSRSGGPPRIVSIVAGPGGDDFFDLVAFGDVLGSTNPTEVRRWWGCISA